MSPGEAREPHQLTISHAAEAIRARRLSSTELLQSCLRHIEQREPEVKAWARLCPESALAEARQADEELAAGQDRGPLHGIPVGIKDVYCTAGIETSAGSRILQGFVPTEDAAAVDRLRQSGAIILGKTATTEFACYDPAPTRNPRNLAHTPGGSSSGSAAALAADMCLGAIGTQTSGSILRPAAYCGVVGLKPTYDLIDRRGIIPLAWSLDHAGPLAKTVADAGLLLDALSGRERAPSKPLPQCTIGIPDRYFTGASAEVLRVFEQAVATLHRLPCKLQPVCLPELFQAGVDAGNLILRVETAAFHQQWFESRAADYSPKLRALIEVGQSIPGVAYLRAQQIRRKALEQMRDLFRQVDVMVTPATPTPAPYGLESTGDPIFNGPFTTFGMPAISVPMGAAENGLPLGLQLAAWHYAEATLLAVAHEFSITQAPIHQVA